ncbi:Hypp234 [Branchiostoma lanceolatum]|uniref:Hypp234 protein n=1 Tax=Branchiostoma lanceolatum TaxID=7740 RepID=A0A8J9VYR2_BRALA|nr:Hypp234 [Branchiostoma lanceolatum]
MSDNSKNWNAEPAHRDMTSQRKTGQGRRKETFAAPSLTPVEEDGDHRTRTRNSNQPCLLEVVDLPNLSTRK